MSRRLRTQVSRQIADIIRTSRDALPFCHLHFQVQKSRNKAYPRKIVSLGDAIRTRRLDLGLLQKDMAKIMGCDKTTITHWEKGHTVPQVVHTVKVVEFLGYGT